VGHVQKRKLPSGQITWRARYRAPGGDERSRSFTRRSDADRFLANIEAEKVRGSWLDPRRSETKLRDWAESWLSSVVHLKPKTRAGYESLLRSSILPAFGEAPLSKLQPQHVREWLGDLTARGMSPSRVRQSFMLLSNLLNAAVESSYLGRNPCIGVKPPRLPRREMRYVDAEQVARLAEAMEPPFGLLVNVLAYGGLRWGEAAALRRKRCDLLRGRLEIAQSLAEVSGGLHFGEPKTYQHRWVRLPRFLRDDVEQHLLTHVDASPEALVFTVANGSPLRHSNFLRSVWKPALVRAGLDDALRPHALRHTCAAMLIAEGANPKAIQAQLGHSTIQVTFDRYGHLFDDHLDELASKLHERWKTSGTVQDAATPRPQHGL